MDWMLSVIMIIFYWLNGNKWKYIWLYSIGMNVLWIIYSAIIQEYGLIPSSAFVLVVSIRNHFKWRKENTIG